MLLCSATLLGNNYEWYTLILGEDHYCCGLGSKCRLWLFQSSPNWDTNPSKRRHFKLQVIFQRGRKHPILQRIHSLPARNRTGQTYQPPMGMSRASTICPHYTFHEKAALLGMPGENRCGGWHWPTFGDFHPVPRLQFNGDNRDSTDSAEQYSVREWYGLIQRAYSIRHLTVMSDKLPAVWALAKLWSQYVDGRYMAGIWEKDIDFGLYWHREHTSSSSRPNVYHCPSW